MVNEQNRIPLLGDPAPSFKAQTTRGPINFPDDYKGSWIVLFSHPADFTRSKQDFMHSEIKTGIRQIKHEVNWFKCRSNLLPYQMD